MDNKPAVYLIDASIYIFRAYFSLPENWHSNEGYPLNAVYGFCAFLLDFLRKTESASPTIIAACFDESLGSCYRNDIFPNYKSSREHPDQALAYQLEQCRLMAETLKLPCFSSNRFEADDYIATLARLAREKSHQITIVSRDKDLGQLLISGGDQVWDFAGNIFTGAEEFAKKFGVRPAQFTDYQALVGDAVDDIPGVPGIGAKSAALLLQNYADLEELAYNLDALASTGIRGAARISGNLREHWEDALMSRNLARLADKIGGVELPAPRLISAESFRVLHHRMASLGLDGPLLRRCEHMAEQAERRP